MNGLKLDIHSEEKAVEMFAQNILDAGNSYLDNPMETPFIPSWTRVNSAIPDLQKEFISAVTEDMNEFSK
jgi:glucosyl-3-phosphoglycerate synthase